MESELRRHLQAARTERQGAALEAESLLALNTTLIDELAERDARLRQLEELVAGCVPVPVPAWHASAVRTHGLCVSSLCGVGEGYCRNEHCTHAWLSSRVIRAWAQGDELASPGLPPGCARRAVWAAPTTGGVLSFS